MSKRSVLPFYVTIAATVLTLIFSVPLAFSQHGSEGTVAVTVFDPSGSVVPGAQVELRDIGTAVTRKGETTSSGTHTFVNLPLGTYRLAVSKQGFKSQVFDAVLVQATKTTDISATLTVGALTETVEVTAAAAPLIETSSNAIGHVIDMKQIEDLPIQGRDLTAMSTLVPGYTGSLLDGGGTFNGLPTVAQGSNIDGVIGNAGRMKFDGGAVAPAAEPRIENIQEMTVQTDQLDLNQGYGNSSMQVNFVTRSGTNAFHGRVFEDFRNDWLNANSWDNDYINAQNPRGADGKVLFPKNKVILNEFGGSVGGPIIKNKLFFFGTFSMRKQPGGYQCLCLDVDPSRASRQFRRTEYRQYGECVQLDLGLHNVRFFGAVAYHAEWPDLINSERCQRCKVQRCIDVTLRPKFPAVKLADQQSRHTVFPGGTGGLQRQRQDALQCCLELHETN